MIIFDPRIEISRGQIPGTSFIRKFGRNFSIDSADSATEIWEGGAPYVYPSNSGVAMTASSSSTSDTSAGTGARSLTVIGLDTGFRDRSVTVDLNGQNGVSLGTFTRVFRAYVETSGSGGTNAGEIYIGSGTITTGVPANKYAQIKTGYGQTLMCIYTIPKNHKGYITASSCSMLEGSTGKTADINLYFRTYNGAKRIQDNFGLTSSGISFIHKPYSIPIPVEEKTDVSLVIESVSANGSQIAGGFTIILVQQ